MLSCFQDIIALFGLGEKARRENVRREKAVRSEEIYRLFAIIEIEKRKNELFVLSFCLVG